MHAQVLSSTFQLLRAISNEVIFEVFVAVDHVIWLYLILKVAKISFKNTFSKHFSTYTATTSNLQYRGFNRIWESANFAGYFPNCRHLLSNGTKYIPHLVLPAQPPTLPGAVAYLRT